MQNLEKLFHDLSIPYKNRENKLSGKGKYISFTEKILILNV